MGCRWVEGALLVKEPGRAMAPRLETSVRESWSPDPSLWKNPHYLPHLAHVGYLYGQGKSKHIYARALQAMMNSRIQSPNWAPSGKAPAEIDAPEECAVNI
jgi:hypothetical protein